jgi:hypothetical protein
MTGTATGPSAPKRSLFKLIGDLPTLVVDLFRAEIESLKQELLGKLRNAGIGVGLIAAAATFAFFALLVLLAAAVLGLATVLPAWAAALIVGGGILLIAIVLLLIGVATLKKGVPPTPTTTIDSVKRDVSVITGTARRPV